MWWSLKRRDCCKFSDFCLILCSNLLHSCTSNRKPSSPFLMQSYTLQVLVKASWACAHAGGQSDQLSISLYSIMTLFHTYWLWNSCCNRGHCISRMLWHFSQHLRMRFWIDGISPFPPWCWILNLQNNHSSVKALMLHRWYQSTSLWFLIRD